MATIEAMYMDTVAGIQEAIENSGRTVTEEQLDAVSERVLTVRATDKNSPVDLAVGVVEFWEIVEEICD